VTAPKLKLSEVVELRGGYAFKSDDFAENGVPIIRISNIHDGGVDLENAAKIPVETIGNGRNYLVESGDILIAMSGATTGKIGVVPNNVPKPLLQNQRVGNYKIKDSSRMDKVFLKFFLTSSIYQAHVKRFAAGAAQPNISASELVDFEISLPPIQKQREIATVLLKVEGSQQKRRATIGCIDDYLNSLFIEMFGDPVSNPKKWPKKRLGDIVAEIESGWSPVCESRPAMPDEKGVLKLGAITWCEYNQSENKALPASEKFDPSIEVKEGDLLFCRKNTHDLVAAAAYVFQTRTGLMMSDLIFRLNPSPASKFSSIFLWRLLINAHQKRSIQSLATGSSGSMPNISKEKLRKVEIISPPTDLQVQFESKVTAIYKLKHKLEESDVELKSLFTAILSESFGGVPS
jgi:type I restriction enzyme S subunit